jgi:hypothetical protein
MPVQDNGPAGIKQDLVLVAVQLPSGKASAGGEATEGVGYPLGQPGYIIKDEHVAVIRRDEKIAIFTRQRSERRCIGID